MGRKKEVDFFDEIIYRIIGIIVIFLLIKCLCELLWYPYDWNSLLERVIVIYLIFSIIIRNKYIFIVSLSISSVVLLIFTLKEYFYGDLGYYVNIIKESLNYYYSCIVNGQGIPEDKQVLIIFLFIILLSSLYHVLVIKYKVYYILSIFGLVIYSITNYLGTLENISDFTLFVTCQIFLFFINKIKQNRKFGYYKLIITGSIFAFLLVNSGSAFSQRYRAPVSLVIDEIESLKLFEKRVSSHNRGVRFIDKESLSFSRNYRDTIVMEVISDNDVYLRGSVCDYFDAITWSNTINTIPHGQNTLMDQDRTLIQLLMNFNRHVIGLGLYDQYSGDMIELMKSEDFTKYFSNNEVSVTYKNLASDVMFLPLNAYGIAANDLGYHVNNGDVLFYDTKLEENFTYSFRYFKPKVGNQLVEKTIINIEGNSTIEENNLSDEERQAYLQLPESITDRTRDLAYQLTKDFNTTYEKSKSIEGYLKNNYQYNLDVPMPEAGVDFVDYFLFDNKQGYCSYYASAMVVLLRSEGMPARFVKGFRASKPKELIGEKPLDPENIDNNTIYVREKDAHAWVEVYIDGFGWLAFEPTSGFNIFNNQANFTPQYEEIIDEATDTIGEGSTVFNYSILIFVLIILALIIIFCIIGVTLWRKKKYSLKSNKERIIDLDGKIIRIINIMSTRRKKEETLKVYYQEMSKDDRLATIDWNKYYKTVERVYYSNVEISIDEVTNCEATYKTLRNLLKEYNKFKYYIYKFSN